MQRIGAAFKTAVPQRGNGGDNESGGDDLIVFAPVQLAVGEGFHFTLAIDPQKSGQGLQRPGHSVAACSGNAFVKRIFAYLIRSVKYIVAHAGVILRVRFKSFACERRKEPFVPVVGRIAAGGVHVIPAFAELYRVPGVGIGIAVLRHFADQNAAIHAQRADKAVIRERIALALCFTVLQCAVGGISGLACVFFGVGHIFANRIQRPQGFLIIRERRNVTRRKDFGYDSVKLLFLRGGGTVFRLNGDLTVLRRNAQILYVEAQVIALVGSAALIGDDVFGCYRRFFGAAKRKRGDTRGHMRANKPDRLFPCFAGVYFFGLPGRRFGLGILRCCGFRRSCGFLRKRRRRPCGGGNTGGEQQQRREQQ